MNNSNNNFLNKFRMLIIMLMNKNKSKFNSNNNSNNNNLKFNKDNKYQLIYLISQLEKCQCQEIYKESKSILTLSSKINNLRSLLVTSNRNNNNE